MPRVVNTSAPYSVQVQDALSTWKETKSYLNTQRAELEKTSRHWESLSLKFAGSQFPPEEIDSTTGQAGHKSLETLIHKHADQYRQFRLVREKAKETVAFLTATIKSITPDKISEKVRAKFVSQGYKIEPSDQNDVECGKLLPHLDILRKDIGTTSTGLEKINDVAGNHLNSVCYYARSHMGTHKMSICSIVQRTDLNDTIRELEDKEMASVKEKSDEIDEKSPMPQAPAQVLVQFHTTPEEEVSKLKQLLEEATQLAQSTFDAPKEEELASSDSSSVAEPALEPAPDVSLAASSSSAPVKPDAAQEEAITAPKTSHVKPNSNLVWTGKRTLSFKLT